MASPLQALPVPSLSDPPNGPAQLLALATALEKKLVMSFATVAARNTAIPTPTAGMVAYDVATSTFYFYNGTAWVSLVTPTPWTGVTFNNSWVNFAGGFNNCEYRKIGDVVYLRGMMKSGTVGGATPAIVLPTGFRPPLPLNFSTVSNSLFGAFNVNADGTLCVSVGSNVWVSINCHFSVTS